MIFPRLLLATNKTIKLHVKFAIYMENGKAKYR